uniref:Uncharacterized protein n=1 Tax=Panagrolaimus superbus TaxID=310955 RepID=A0A914XU85_9BILA
MDKFTNIIGTSSVTQTVEYIDSLNAICDVRPLEDELDYLSLKNLVPVVHEAYITTKHRRQPPKFSLDSLVYGLQNLLKTFVFIKRKNIDENFVLHFPESPLQHFEILNRFNHEQNGTKEMLKFLTLLNSNVATYNINPTLKTAHVTSVEILLDVIIDFWKGFRFSTTSFAAIPLSALGSASNKISEYQSFIWIARNIIQNYSDILSDQIIAQTNAFMGDVSDNISFFNQCKDVLKMVIPAKGLVDPGLTDIVNLSVNQSREKVLQLFAICSKLFPAQASAHPILRYIHDNVVKTAETIECLEQKKIKVYRTSHLKFDEFNTELRQFYSRWLSALDGYIVREGPWYRNIAFSTVLGHSTRTNTLINLAQSFCEVC